MGLQAEDVRDVGLKGRSDDEVLTYAVAHEMAVLTADLHFSNLLRFPLGSHAGIGIARFPNETPNPVLNQAILEAMQALTDEEIRGALIIIEPGRVRLRQKDPWREKE